MLYRQPGMKGFLFGYTGDMNTDKHVAITMDRRHKIQEEVEKRSNTKEHCKAAIRKRLNLKNGTKKRSKPTKGIEDKEYNDLYELLSKNRKILGLLKKDLALPTFKPAEDAEGFSSDGE